MSTTGSSARRVRAILAERVPVPPLLLWATVIGVVGALATIAFRDALTGLEWLLTGRSGSLVELSRSLPWQWRLAFPVIGGAAAGWILTIARRHAPAGGDDYMAAIAYHDGTVAVRHSLLSSSSSLLTIASGGSIGREGPMVQLAAMCASLTARKLRLPVGHVRLLVACGAAAGIAAAYNAPIASAFFVSEIVLGSIVMDSFGPIVVAAVVANMTMREFPGYRPTYEMPTIAAAPLPELAAFIVLGALAGLFAPQFLRLLQSTRKSVGALGLPLPVAMALGGLAVGAISVWNPQVWGNGYSVVNSLLHTPWLWTTVLAVLVLKVIATTATYGSGAVGGIFTPTLFVGAASGWLFGYALQALWPGAVSPQSMYAVIGMGAFLAAATGAPLMAILMIFEMTLSYQVMLPLMLACVLAYFIARGQGAAMYDITVTRIEEEKSRAHLRTRRMRDLVQPAETVLPLDASFDALTRMFLQHPVKYVYAVDAANRYQGAVALQEITSQLLDQASLATRKVGDFVRTGQLQTVTADMTLDEALRCFLAHQGERLPVVRSQEDPQLLGAVYKTTLLQAYHQLNGQAKG